MKNILVTTDFTLAEGSRISEIASGHQVCYKDRLEVTPEDMKKANIILGNITPKLFADTPNLEWVQLQTAGTDGYLKEGVLGENVVLTNVTGAFGETISEYVLGAVLGFKNHFPFYTRQQANKSWDKLPVTSLKASTVLVLGLGDIGSEVCKKMKAMGGYVIAVKRRPSEKPDFVDELHYEADLDELIPRADVMVLTIPMYQEVRYIINKERIDLMKRDMIFVNIARGGLVEQAALTDALQSKRIAGAVLDVFEIEPLPQDDMLWTLENVLITPHNAGGFRAPLARKRIAEIMIGNLERYLKGEPLINIIDKKTGYCI